MNLTALGKSVFFLGLGVTAVGALLMLVGRGILPHLPGDFSLRFGNARVYLPLASSIVLSIVLTLVLNLIARR